MQYLLAMSTLCVGLFVGASGSAWYLNQNQAQHDRLLSVALSTQRRMGHVEDACSQRCTCQYPDLNQLRTALDAPAGASGVGVTAGLLAAAPAPSVSARPEPSPEQVAQLAKAQDLLSAATRAQRWTETDRDRLRELVRGLPSEESRQISFSLVQLINEGKLHPDDGVPPF